MCFWDLMGQNGSNDYYYYSNWRIITFHPWNLNPKTTLNCSEIKSDCIKARTKMLKWIFRYRKHGGVWKEKVQVLGVCPRPDSAEGGDRAFNERSGERDSWSRGSGKEGGRRREDREGGRKGGQDTTDATQRGRLPRVCVCLSLRCCKSYMHFTSTNGHQRQGKTEELSQTGGDYGVWQLNAVRFPTLDPEREKGC